MEDVGGGGEFFMHSSSAATLDDRLEIYTELQERFPKSQAPFRLVLNFLTGDRFRSAVDAYLRTALHKGVPPLFVNLRSLYKDNEKVRLHRSYSQ